MTGQVHFSTILFVRVKKVLGDLFLAAFLFLILVVLGLLKDIADLSVYPTQFISKEIYTSVLDPIEQREKIIFNGARVNRKVALTFDADMTHEMKAQIESEFLDKSINEKVIEILEKSNTKATLFLSGMWIEMHREETSALAANSLFELANHSYSHPSFSGDCYGLISADPQHKADEIIKTQELLYALTGEENDLFRFPGGCYSASDLDMLSLLEINSIQWDVIGGDGFNDDPASIEREVISAVRPGSIIVLHMNGYPNSPTTHQALPGIIFALKSKGYEFVTVSELLEESDVKFTRFLDNTLPPPTRLATL